MTIKLSLITALCLIAVNAQAQDATHDSSYSSHGGHGGQEHRGHAPSRAGADGTAHDRPHHGHHQQPAHGQMNHDAMDHSRHEMPHPSRVAVPAEQHSRTPIPAITPADRAAAFPDLPAHDMHQGGSHFMFVADELEWQDANDGSTLAWNLNGWWGGDIDRLAFRSEGERTNGHTEEAELQLLWSHAIGPWWETVAGVRQDFKPGSPQTWAAFGIQGMPLYGLETEATAFIGEGGQTSLRLEAEYDMLLTQRWVLQPKAEVNLHGRNDASRGVGAGFSDASIGLRLRYEINRQLAPYVGVSWTRAYGNSADMLRSEDEDTSEARLVAGIRFWF
ncbi:copper resistance protein B [Stutzerimonas zhaodongensis]|nr:copper resistance protein B [Stutzerimonas zhaodongensis]MCQ4314875.1 copper resistance protein B [Stutzerimonas zhaodongensis]